MGVCLGGDCSASLYKREPRTGFQPSVVGTWVDVVCHARMRTDPPATYYADGRAQKRENLCALALRTHPRAAPGAFRVRARALSIVYYPRPNYFSAKFTSPCDQGFVSVYANALWLLLKSGACEKFEQIEGPC